MASPTPSQSDPIDSQQAQRHVSSFESMLPNLVVVNSPYRRPPIDRLPPELLSEVFVLAVPGHPSDFNPFNHGHMKSHDDSSSSSQCFPRLSFDAQPSSLILVSKWWRAVASNTPRLWTSFAFRLPYTRDDASALEEVEPQLALLLSWLSLSKQLPLTFCWDTPHRECEFLQELLREIHRWHTVCLQSYTSSMTDMWAMAIPQAALLERLRFSTDSSLQLNQFPRLQQLNVRWDGFQVPELNSQRLTHLTLRGGLFSPFSAVEIASRLPCLISFECHFHAGFPPTDVPTHQHSSLRELKLEGWLSGICEFLSLLHTPPIHTLHMYADSDDYYTWDEETLEMHMNESALPMIRSYLERHKSSLREFRFMDHMISSTIDDTNEFLRLAPNLEYFEVQARILNDQYLSELTIAEGSDKAQILGPELVDFRIAKAESEDYTMDSLIKMLLSRWKYNMQTRISIKTRSDGWPMDNAEVIQMIRKGARLRFNDWSSDDHCRCDEYMDWRTQLWKSFSEA